MNTVILSGHLGADITIRTIGNGAIVGNFSLATKKVYTNKKNEKIKETQWHRVQVWGRNAENMERWTHKGSRVTVIGELIYDTFKNRNDENVTLTKVNASQVEFLDPVPKQKRENAVSEQSPEVKEKRESQLHNAIDDLPF